MITVLNSRHEPGKANRLQTVHTITAAFGKWPLSWNAARHSHIEQVQVETEW